jgi:hypothetical protein
MGFSYGFVETATLLGSFTIGKADRSDITSEEPALRPIVFAVNLALHTKAAKREGSALGQA